MPFSAIILLIVLNIILKIPYFDLPLNRDAGTFLYAGQEILRGKLPYIDFVDNKPPMSYFFAAALIYLFGNSIFFMRLFVLITIIVSAFLVYGIGERLTNSKIVGVYSGLIYSLFISMPYTWSFEFMTTNLMEIFGLFSIFLAVKYKNGVGLSLSGAAASLSALSKQPGILFFFIVIFLIWIQTYLCSKFTTPQKRKITRQLIYFISGSLLVIIPFIFIIVSYNIFWQFFYWVINQNFIMPGSSYLSKINTFYDYIIKDNFLLYILAISSLVLLYQTYRKKEKNSLYEFALLFCLFWIAIFGLFVIFARQIQPHYFYSFVAPLSIMSAIFFERFNFNNKKIFKIFFIIFLLIFLLNYATQITKFKNEVVSAHVGIDYNTQLKIASDIIRLTKNDDKVLVLFSSPEYYFLSDREAPIKYPQFNQNYISEYDKISIIRGLIAKKSQKIIIVRTNDWGSSEDIVKYVKKEYALYRNYESYDKIEIYVMKN